MEVYDYVDGKVDWMGYGLPVEGDDGPFAGEFAVEMPTVGPDNPVAEVLDVLGREGADRAVVTVAEGVVLGLVARTALAGASPSSPVAEVMELSPTTVRPSTEYATLFDKSDEPVLVTTSDGRLIGMVEPKQSDDGRDLERSLLETISAVEEHFGEREVSEDDIRSFLRDRLVAEGKTPEEADRFITGMVEEPAD